MYERVGSSENLIQEEWKEIPGFENKYWVSNYGRVKNKNKVMKPMKYSNGYLGVCLWKDGKQVKISIHRLVAQLFIENPNNYPEVNHKDENKINNFKDNLEWCTHKYNLNYGDVRKKISIANKGKRRTQETLKNISENSRGRIWINNGIIEKFIKKEDFQNFITWERGRLNKGGDVECMKE